MTAIISPPPLRGRVNFVVGGTQKGGTTALRRYLIRHPEICMPSNGEGHFFDLANNFQTEVPDYGRYEGYFQPKGREHVLGEKTPIYMYWYDAPRRIWEYNSQMKWILLLRNPVERAHSNWHMEHRRGADDVDFLRALQQEGNRCKAALPLQHRLYSYVDRGFYAEQLHRIWHFFPRNQTLICKSEDLREHPRRTLDAVCEFLTVESFAEVKPLTAQVQSDRQPMSDEAREFLVRVYEQDVRLVEQLLGWDCSDWLD